MVLWKLSSLLNLFGKCNLICPGKNTEHVIFFFINTAILTETKEEKFMGLIIDNKVKCKVMLESYLENNHQKRI